MSIPQERIRNFCIIAHIDHGKSTLADRILQFTGAVSERDMSEQLLDQMDLERERGITIKLQAVRMVYKAKDGQEYLLNLIDTPGHVDFTYEVSRSLAACEGALLVVDAAQGIEAQTLANVYLALEHDLEIIPVINKIDLPSAEPERVKEEIEEIIGLDTSDAVLTSAKTGQGTEQILEAIIRKIPHPAGKKENPLQALIFDSLYDSYKGAIPFIRIMEGSARKGMKIKMMATNKQFEVNEVGVFTPAMRIVEELNPGEVGFLTASIKNVKDTQVGDTITDALKPAAAPLPGYRKVTSMVYCGLYPVDSEDYEDLKEALEKLQLNDAALKFEPETSVALGFGFRCGFLGLLHMEIIQERLEREFKLNLLATAPSVIYEVYKSDGTMVRIDNPANLPPINEVEEIREPFVKATIMVPNEYVGAVMELCQDKRGEYETMEYLSPNRAMLTYYLPLAEIIYDFFDMLKSRTRGYASLDYELHGYKGTDLVKMDVLVNGQIVDALSFIVHREKSYYRGQNIARKLKDLIPRHLFEIPIQAAIGSKVIARTNVKALRKNVIDKCYGGDITRKKKLLEKQKEGKKRMKQIGNVEIPQEAFMAVLSLDED
ncbi:MAG: translation elongation factor 4 [Bacillota bacterium]